MNKAIGYITLFLILAGAFAFKREKNIVIPQSNTQQLVDTLSAQKFDISTSDLSSVDKEQQRILYIKRFAGVAQEEEKLFGIPASISLAQGILESASGTSTLAVRSNNHFGIKCFEKKCKEGHCTNFSDDTHKDFFIKYNNAWESWRAHSHFLNKKHYRSLKKSKNYKSWANGLQNKGYATSKSYAETLINIIEKYKLYQYDESNR